MFIVFLGEKMEGREKNERKKERTGESQERRVEGMRRKSNRLSTS